MYGRHLFPKFKAATSARLLLLSIVSAVAITGCQPMNIDTVSKPSPKFDFTEYFLNQTKASGWFADRFGKVKRHFCGEFNGRFEDDVFVLDETLNYSDGVVERRVWKVAIDDDGNFKATSDSLVGNAVGQLKGNTLNLKYSLRVDLADGKQWVLDMDDWLFLQPDGTVHNMTEVRKWGFRVGTVSTQFFKSEPVENTASCDGTLAVDSTNGSVVRSVAG